MNINALLDPEIAPTVSAMLAAGAPLTMDTLPAVRAAMIQSADGQVLSDEVIRSDHRLTAPDGHEFAVRVHRSPSAQGNRPALIWIHGGGMVAGTHLREDARFDDWCRRFGIVGVAVDYGLAPERPFPGPLQDCYTALGWVAENAAELGVERTAIGIGGSSAGGGLAAALALFARDRNEFPVAFQTLVYPMLDDRMITASSNWDVPVWPPAANDFGWNAYLAGRRGADDVPAYAAPARATELGGLPPTFIGVGTLDGFVDEDIDYAQRLMHAGVPVELHVYPGAPHGYELYFAGSRVVTRAQQDLDGWLAATIESVSNRSPQPGA